MLALFERMQREHKKAGGRETASGLEQWLKENQFPRGRQKRRAAPTRVRATRNQSPGAPPPPPEEPELPPPELLDELLEEDEELELLELEDEELELLEEEELEEELDDELLELEDDELDELELPESWTTALLLVMEPAELETTTE